jgi:hypothetical protein
MQPQDDIQGVCVTVTQAQHQLPVSPIRIHDRQVC